MCVCEWLSHVLTVPQPDLANSDLSLQIKNCKFSKHNLWQLFDLIFNLHVARRICPAKCTSVRHDVAVAQSIKREEEENEKKKSKNGCNCSTQRAMAVSRRQKCKCKCDCEAQAHRLKYMCICT